MAITAEELKIIVRAEVSQAQRRLKDFNKTTKKTGINAKELVKTLIGVGGVVAGLNLLKRAVIGNITEGLRFAAAMEQQQAAFETLLGGAAQARELFKDIQEFSAATPFQLPELTSAAQRLIAFGTEATDVVQTMRDLGNAAQGNSEVLGRLVNAYGKVQAKGRATLEELNMFTEAGVPIMRALGDELGLTKEELFKFVSAGKVGFAEVQAAVQSLTRDTGQFAGGLAKQSETLNGKISTLKDNWDLLRGAMVGGATPWLKTVATNLTNIAIKMRDNITVSEAFNRVMGETLQVIQGLGAAENLARVNEQLDALGLVKSEVDELHDLTGFDFDIGLLKELRRGSKLLGREIKSVDDVTELMTTLNEETERLQTESRALKTELNRMTAGLGVATGATSGLTDGQKLLNAEFAKTEAGQRRALQATIARIAAFEDQGEVTLLVLRSLRGELAAMQEELGSPTSVAGPSFLFDKIFPTVADTKGIGAFKEGVLDLSETLTVAWEHPIEAMRRFRIETEKTLIATQMAAARELIKTYADLGNAIANTFGAQTLSFLSNFGSVMADGARNTNDAALAFQDFRRALMDAIPALLLQTGLALLPNPAGFALIGASGLLSLIGGIMDPPSSRVSEPAVRGRPAVQVVNFNGTYLDAQSAGRRLLAQGASDYRGY